MRLAASSVLRGQLSRRLYSSSRTIQENDVVFLRQHGKKYPKWHLTSPLRADSRIKLAYGASINSSDLIGRRVLDVVPDSSGYNVVLHQPSMASYIINSPRLATPIYPHDANTIVSLLDLNLSRPGEEDHDNSDQPFEIFEAGTGMGSLTLHLARALHAANPPLSPSLRNALCAAPHKRDEFGLELSPEDQTAYDKYLAGRRAVLHTLDRNHRHSKAAHNLVRNFRRSLYFPTVDFHLGSVGEYISGRLAETDGQPFLSHAILDLPSAHEHAAQVIQALHPNGLLVIFNPSISQIADFQTWAVRSRQPIRPERVIELAVSTTADGVNDTGGGKEWDVKTVVPREEPDAAPVQIMRPKVGDRLAGGGFVAVLRRWPIKQIPSEVEPCAEEVVSEVDGDAEIERGAEVEGVAEVDGVVSGEEPSKNS
ncbi:hypothetical protein FZEAL_1119 [Fusarium zealandicum]|uniref:tRNA (adenine(58)-N(1))-methyltransferase catalytic subunit TRM61 n=1 Tax=Fusarium zealandicum TaxID=1053134 RepID=A0A8H4XP19_9HYPO|nr:hypothetical protein FZEAL_1119 [Fusarium zealandicum]